MTAVLLITPIPFSQFTQAEKDEDDDLTINTKLAMEAIEDWFCSPESDKGREKETSREIIAQDGDHGGAGSKVSSGSSGGGGRGIGDGGDVMGSNDLFGPGDKDDQENSAGLSRFHS